jgi:hypothetical protein
MTTGMYKSLTLFVPWQCTGSIQKATSECAYSTAAECLLHLLCLSIFIFNLRTAEEIFSKYGMKVMALE